MARLSVGTDPIQIAWYNPKRFSLAVEFVASSVIAGNTGLVYGKFGSCPVASIISNTWDFLLNAGAVDGTNTAESLGAAPDFRDLWLVSDTADQIINYVERNTPGN
jgi:hypothetical protein